MLGSLCIKASIVYEEVAEILLAVIVIKSEVRLLSDSALPSAVNAAVASPVLRGTVIDFSRPLIVVAFAAITALAVCKASINKSLLGML